jgi:DNA replication protein DnaC
LWSQARDRRRRSVVFTTAIDIVKTVAAAQSAGRLKRKIGRFLKRGRLIVDELGHLPIDGVDMLFKIISRRYERVPGADHHQPRDLRRSASARMDKRVHRHRVQSGMASTR